MAPGIRERIGASVRVLRRVMPLAGVLFRARAEASPRVLHPARATALMDAGAGRKMEIMIFPVKLDKFKVFFDKFLKRIVSWIRLIFSVYSIVYTDNLKKNKNDLSKFIE